MATVLGNDHDTAPDSDLLVVTGAGQGGNPITLGTPFTVAGGGVLTLFTDGSYTFNPGTAYNGLDLGEHPTETIVYTLSDGNGGVTTAELIITIDGVNDAPVVIDPANPGTPANPIPAADPLNIIPDVSATDGQALTPILVGDVVVDPEGKPLLFTLDPGLPSWLHIDPASGEITGVAPAGASQGTNTGTPGEYLITITATDSHGTPVSTTVTLTIANLPPVAVDDRPAVSEDGPQLSGTVLGNDHDTAPDSDLLTVTGAGQGGNPITLGTPFTVAGGGVLTLFTDGSYTFNPGTAYNGLDLGEHPTETISYTLSDGNGGVTTAELVITIDGVNDAPVVIDPANPGTPANPIPAADPLNIIPDVSATDGQALTPILVGDVVVDPEGKPMLFTLDPGLPSWLHIDPASGEITGVAPAGASQGTNTGTPGEYLITITATDSHGTPVSTTVTLTIGNLPPVAVDDRPAVSEDGPQLSGTVLGNDHDTAPDSDLLTVTGAEQGGNPITLGTPFTVAGGGVLTLFTDGSYTFNPGTAYNGLDLGEHPTETIIYTLSDGNGGVTTAELVITIDGVNDAPVVIDPANPGTPANPIPAADPLNIIPDVSATDGQALTPILVGDVVVDPEGKPLLFTLDPGLPSWLHIDPASGEITGVAPAGASQGTNTGTPGEYLITITATDSHGTPVTTTVTLTIANLPPVAVDDTPAVSEDGPQLSGTVLGNDHDTAPDSDLLVVTGAGQGGNPITLGTPFTLAGGGVLTLFTDGSYTFNPGTAYIGLPVGQNTTETVRYTISDGNGGQVTADLIITIEGRNDLPLIIDPSTGLPLAAGQPVIPAQHGTDGQPVASINTAGFFKDPDLGDTMSYAVANLPAGLEFNPLTGVISGSLNTHASVHAPYLVEVTATDNHGGKSIASFVWAVDNPVPVAMGEEARTTAGVALQATVAGNDVDPDADGIVYRLASGPAHGTLTLSPNGTYTYVADSMYSGPDSFTYAVVDADGGVSYAVCMIKVNAATNITQVSTGAGWHATDHSAPLPPLSDVVSQNEYVRRVASEEAADEPVTGGSEHIRLVVEGRTHQLDQQYGAAPNDMPLHWGLGLGRDRGHGGGTVYEPLGDAPFWNGLKALDFSGLLQQEAFVGAPDSPALAAADAGLAVPFGEKLAHIRGRFDREALRLMADLEDAA